MTMIVAQYLPKIVECLAAFSRSGSMYLQDIFSVYSAVNHGFCFGFTFRIQNRRKRLIDFISHLRKSVGHSVLMKFSPDWHPSPAQSHISTQLLKFSENCQNILSIWRNGLTIWAIWYGSNINKERNVNDRINVTLSGKIPSTHKLSASVMKL